MMARILKKIIEGRKIESQRRQRVLLNIAQRYYLEIWLMVQEKYNALTLPSDLYRSDYVDCPWARERAKKRVADIIQNGNLNRNYNRLMNRLSETNLTVSQLVYKLARCQCNNAFSQQHRTTLQMGNYGKATA